METLPFPSTKASCFLPLCQFHTQRRSSRVGVFVEELLSKIFYSPEQNNAASTCILFVRLVVVTTAADSSEN